MTKKSMSDETLYALTAYLNNLREDFNNNIIEIYAVAEELSELCMELDAGNQPYELDLTSVSTKSLEVTKSDPLAGTPEDPLKEATDAIKAQKMLPTLNIDYLMTNLIIVQSEFDGSTRRHSTRRDSIQLKGAETLPGSIQYIMISSNDDQKQKNKTLFPKKHKNGE